MRNFLNYENDFMSTVARLSDSVVLGALWLVCSIPVFTVGASSAALYFAYNRCIRQRTGYAWKTFFSSFRDNFKQATKIWLTVLVLTVFAAIDCYILGSLQQAASWTAVIQTVIIGFLLLMIMWSQFLFPYLSRFENPNKIVIKNSFLIMLANMPQSILLTLLFAACVAAFLFVPAVSFFVPTLYIFIANKILERIFKKYMSAEDLEKEASYS